MQEVRTVSVRADRSVYLGARNASKVATIRSGTGPDGWLVGYYGSFMADPQQDALYTDLLGEFEKIRAGSDLDDDEYVELLTAFVQSLPYASDYAQPRYPVETVVDGRGTATIGVFSWRRCSTAQGTASPSSTSARQTTLRSASPPQTPHLEIRDTQSSKPRKRASSAFLREGCHRQRTSA